MCTEQINFAAAQWGLVIIDDTPAADADRDTMIRDLADFGPAITERD
jgi:hypothetical protein